MKIFILILKCVILAVGLIGNTIGLIVYITRAQKIPSRHLLIALAIADLVSLTYVVGRDILEEFDFVLKTMSDISCKFSIYIYSSICSNSTWLLATISAEKFVLICYPNVMILKKKRFQIAALIGVFSHSFVLYSPVLFIMSLANTTDNISACDYTNSNTEVIFNWVDIGNSVYLPFLIMLIFSVLLIHFILKSRLRILRLNTQHDRNRLKKDIRFAISTLFLNLFYFTITLPTSVLILMGHLKVSDFNNIHLTIYYISFGANFYILFSTNTLIRKHTLLMFKFGKYA